MNNDINNELVAKCEDFLRTYYRGEIEQLAQSDRESLAVDWSDMYASDPDFAEDYLSFSDELKGHLEYALPDVVPAATDELQGKRIRVCGVEPEYEVGEYRPEEIGRPISVNGQVSQVSQPKPELVAGTWRCLRCGSITDSEDPREPSECAGCERQGPFELLKNDSVFRQTQTIRIQQPPEKASNGERHVDVVVHHDLASYTGGGERVRFSGVLDVEDDGTDSPTMDYYLEGDALEVTDGSYEDIDIEQHREAIKDIRESDDPIGRLEDSFAPQLARNDDLEVIIEALILQMCGAERKDPADGPTYRGDSHVLLLGDPGTAKSELLQEVEKLAPLAKFKSGKGVSKAGMIASAVADDFGASKWSLKAGLMVLASGGIACLDEIDKVDEQALDAAHSALENQRVSISKAGIDAELPARTALLAAGNPKHGRFDQYEPVGEQINMPPSLLSRFDLMFMLADTVDASRDIEIGEHIAASWSATGRKAAGEHVDESVADREIPEDVFTAYIAAARKEVQPVIRDAKIERLAVKKYSELRHANGYDEESTVPVTARKLEALLRLAEASARARFSETVDVEDIERAARLVEKSMQDVGVDPDTGEFDADVIETGKSNSQRQKMKTILAIVSELCAEHDDGAPRDTVVDRAESEGIDNAEKYVEELLVEDGELYEPMDGHLRRS